MQGDAPTGDIPHGWSQGECPRLKEVVYYVRCNTERICKKVGIGH